MIKMTIEQRHRAMIDNFHSDEPLTYPRIKEWFKEYFPNISKQELSWSILLPIRLMFTLPKQSPYLSMILNVLKEHTRHFNGVTGGLPVEINNESNYFELVIYLDSWLSYMGSTGIDWIILDNYLSELTQEQVTQEQNLEEQVTQEQKLEEQKLEEQVTQEQNLEEQVTQEQNWLDTININKLLRYRLSVLINNGQFDHLIIRDVERLLQ